jgi:cobalt-zinc-cadmium efflux system outer membrane protein
MSPAIMRSDALARAAAARVRPAGALSDPMLSLGVMDLTLPRFAFHESDFTEFDVEVSQQFPWPGTRGAQSRAAQATARSASATASLSRRKIAQRVAMLYYRLRYVVTAQQALNRQRSLLAGGVDISTSRYGTGNVPQSDPLLARVALARLEAEGAALRAEEAGLRADLRAVRGIRGQDSLAVAPFEYDSIAALAGLTDSVHAAHLAIDNPLKMHPRLVAASMALEAAQETATAERLNGRPDFEISTRYGARPLGADFFSAFVGIRLSLWAGRKQRLLVEAANLDAEAARHALDQDEAELSAELDRTLAEAQAGADRIRILVERVIPTAREGLEAALRGYRVGRNDFLSVLTTQGELYRAESETAQVAAEHLTHLVMLELLLEPEDSR